MKYLIIGAFILSAVGITAQERHDGEITAIAKNRQYSGRESAVTDYIAMYQKYISSARGSHCPMYPSCSNYGLMVFRERPFYEAMLLTADRLTRCGNDRHFYHETSEYGSSRLLDLPPYKPVPDGLIYQPTRYFYTDNLKAKTKEDSSKLFVNYLINNAQYNPALLEIERNIYNKRDCDADYYINKLICYEALNREEDAVYDYLTRFPESVRENEKVKIKIAKIYYNIDNYEQSLTILNKKPFRNEENKQRSIVLQGIIATQNSDYGKAKLLFTEASSYGMSSLISGKNQRIIEEISHQKPKKPVVAKLLSIVPGGGYIYTKNYKNAITALLINAALGYATYSCIDRENYGMAVLTGIFSLSFYTGNIMGAGNSAVRYNQHIVNRGVNQLKINNQIINY
ncbi:MAG: membrane protein insertion efficiency factor YidD [Dysgonamonadaceae bacterium]|jgi:putative component of membrane protein insertase Oxa1/YidC/SpoIIIJ protein YidD|nr:membrane protein insertion efficiency factor YidD [Dysgonamonadaceae bacterium]